MQINKEIVHRELIKRIEMAFLLPEIHAVKIRDIVIMKTQGKEYIYELSKEAVEMCYHVVLSDIDMSVLVKLPNHDIPEEQYMRMISRFGFERETYLGLTYAEESKMYRIILLNGMRYDFGFEFIYDEKADTILETSFVDAAGDGERWSTDSDRFWFVQIQAIAKLYRNDFLISDHLANMNINETLVQQMVLRDMEYGTNFHRYGYQESLEYLECDMAECPYKSDNAIFNLIASKIYSAAVAYDNLTSRLYPQYNSRREILFSIWDCYEKCCEG